MRLRAALDNEPQRRCDDDVTMMMMMTMTSYYYCCCIHLAVELMGSSWMQPTFDYVSYDFERGPNLLGQPLMIVRQPLQWHKQFSLMPSNCQPVLLDAHHERLTYPDMHFDRANQFRHQLLPMSCHKLKRRRKKTREKPITFYINNKDWKKTKNTCKTK